MRAAAVQLSTIRKYRRLDAGFYCGLVDGDDIDKAISDAQKRLCTAARRLTELCEQKRKHSNRIARMIHDGEIVPLVPED